MLSLGQPSAMVDSIREGSMKVEAILSELKGDLTAHKLSSQKQQSLLEQLKVLGRTPAQSDAIFARDGISTLIQYAFDTQELDVAREASRCLANAMLLSESSRQMLVDFGYVDKAVKRLESDNLDDEFLLSRIIFLLTYKTTVDLIDLVKENTLATSICENIRRHVRRTLHSPPNQAPPALMEVMALNETLKLLFNITAKQPDLASDFAPIISFLTDLLTHVPIPTPPLQAPITLLLNALMNLDLSIPTSTSIFTPNTTNRLITLLDLSTKAYSETELDSLAMPLVTLIRQYHTGSASASASDSLLTNDSESSPSVHLALVNKLLPNETTRAMPLGKDDSLPSRLLRLSISSALLSLRDNLAALLFELSDSDPAKYIQKVGYGHAAGFLASHQIEVPAGAMGGAGGVGDAAGGGAAAAEADAGRYNPVTGQRRDREAVADEGPEMTEDEKMREAERLFVLFERLRATGVVDIQNPVTQARNEGRFEEVDD